MVQLLSSVFHDKNDHKHIRYFPPFQDHSWNGFWCSSSWVSRTSTYIQHTRQSSVDSCRLSIPPKISLLLSFTIFKSTRNTIEECEHKARSKPFQSVSKYHDSTNKSPTLPLPSTSKFIPKKCNICCCSRKDESN